LEAQKGKLLADKPLVPNMKRTKGVQYAHSN